MATLVCFLCLLVVHHCRRGLFQTPWPLGLWGVAPPAPPISPPLEPLYNWGNFANSYISKLHLGRSESPNDKPPSTMLTETGRNRFHQMIKLGCTIKLVPFDWSPEEPELVLATPRGKIMFYLHAFTIYAYTISGAFKFLILKRAGKEFPLFQKLTSSLWTLAFTLTSITFLELNFRGEDIIRYANLVLEYIQEPSGTSFKVKGAKERKIERKGKKALSIHIYVALFLLYSNAPVHTLITVQSPCTPLYVSSSYFPCKSVEEYDVNILEQIPFLLFEFYTVSVFLYICCFMWAFVFLGLGHVAIELRRLRARMSTDFHKVGNILHKYRESEVFITVLNNGFVFFLMAFPMILFMIVAMLIFGTIRLWHVNPQSNVMFPLCGMRCGFEGLTPLAMAGHVNRASGLLLDKWRKMRNDVPGLRWKREAKLLGMVQRSCRKIQCTSGSQHCPVQHQQLLPVDPQSVGYVELKKQREKWGCRIIYEMLML